MNSALLAIVGLSAFAIAYRFYGGFWAKRIYRLDPSRKTPAVEFYDGKDFVPTRKDVLLGHHFTSIAGAAPIVGPAIAVIWGWVPALLWIVLGTIFMGAVHDFGALVMSIRNRGDSIGTVSERLISPRARTLFLLIIFFLLWLVVSVFAMVIAVLFIHYPSSVLPIWLQIPIAVFVGYMIYSKGGNPVVWGLLGLAMLFFTFWLGELFPIRLPEDFLGIGARNFWYVLLLIYIYIASTLPVQWLLQPRDYINSYQLYFGVGLLLIGVMVVHPPVVAPALNLHPVGAPPLVPILFITIACGAISGFHSLVSSGTSSKQLKSEPDAHVVGYGGMLLEGSLSLMVVLACTAGIALSSGEHSGPAAFTHYYAEWAGGKGLITKLMPFIEGAANIFERIGLPHSIAATAMSVMIICFAATTLDTATRLQRYVLQELARDYHIKPLKNTHGATAFAVGSAALLIFSNPKGALVLWPVFGTTNQLLAGLALLTLTIYVWKKAGAKYALLSFIPMLFVVAMTAWAMVLNLLKFMHQGKILLLVVAAIILILDVWLLFEGSVVLSKIARGKYSHSMVD